MNERLAILITITIGLSAILAGCTVHPQGEQDERRAAIDAGRSFSKPPEQRAVPLLPVNPSADDLVHFALLANGDIEKAYWDWRSAIEQIPQDGTQPTNLALSANLNFSRGSTDLAHAVIGAGNDPMADIVLPPKLSIAARRALENARAAGLRFRKAQFELRKKVLDAYYDYALTAESIRLQQSTAESLATTARLTEARNNAGAGAQQDVLKAENEVDLSNNDIAAMQAQLPAERSALNALLNRMAEAPLPIPDSIPAQMKMELSDEQLFALAEQSNPEFTALAHDIAGRKDAIALAKLQNLPDISISANTDLKGIAQTLLGTVTVPWLRHEAIDAAISQAEANLKSAQAMRRQAHGDIVAATIMDIATIRDADRQLDLFEQAIIPRIKQSNALARTAYETSNLSFLDVLESQRSLTAIERLVANLRVLRARSLADLEAITARGLERVDAFEQVKTSP